MVKRTEGTKENKTKIRRQRINSLLIYASGHTYTETYQKAISFGITKQTAKGYMKQLTNYLIKQKPIPMEPKQLKYKKNPYNPDEIIIGKGSDIIKKSVVS